MRSSWAQWLMAVILGFVTACNDSAGDAGGELPGDLSVTAEEVRPDSSQVPRLEASPFSIGFSVLSESSGRAVSKKVARSSAARISVR